MLRAEEIDFPQGRVPRFVSGILTVARVVVTIVIEIASNGLPLKDLHEQVKYILLFLAYIKGNSYVICQK